MLQEMEILSFEKGFQPKLKHFSPVCFNIEWAVKFVLFPFSVKYVKYTSQSVLHAFEM